MLQLYDRPVMLASANMSETQTQQESWKPVLSDKQRYLLRLCREKTGFIKAVGIFGPRKTGKTIGATHAIADHLWNTRDGAALVLVWTAGTGATSGVWTELVEKVMPEWIAGGFGMQWVMEPKVHGATKKMICSVLNKYGAEALKNGEPIPPGGISKLELDSLDDEQEVEKRYKSRYYSLIYWSEASEYKERKSLTTLFMALRIKTLKADDHVLLIDANPPKEGTQHFLFYYFFQLRLASDPDPEEAAIQKCLHVTEWNLTDNPFLSQDDINTIKGLYASDPEEYDRYIRGMWVRSISNTLFADVFKTAQHTAGELGNPPTLLLPSENCRGLITSHDAGSANPVSYIIERLIFDEPYKDRDGKDQIRQISFFQYLDELEFVGRGIIVREFTHKLLDKMEFWEHEIGREIPWEHYSDSSALDMTESIAGRSVADEMFAVSGGKIKLIGVEKGHGSVAARIRLWRRFLMENRVLISAAKCPKLIEANQCIEKGKTEGTVAKHSTEKHFWDAASYGPYKLCWDELQSDVRRARLSMRKEEANSTGITHIRI